MSQPVPAGALSGVRVVDASDCVAGEFATRLMADYGADVVLAEPPGGSGERTARPARFWHLNAGKRSRVLGGPVGESTAELVGLAREADVVVVRRPELADALARECPDAIVALVTDFGTTGPYRDWVGSELIHQALSGTMFMTGLAHREPLYGVGERASYSAGLWLYVGVLAALYRRAKDGTAAGPVEVSVHEAAASMEQNFSTQFAYNGTYPWRGERVRTKSRAECRGGWISYFVQRGQWPIYCAMLDAEDLVDDPRFARWPDLVKNWAEAAVLLAERAKTVSIEDVIRVTNEHRLVLAPMVSPVDLRSDEHLLARDYWQEVPTPEGHRLALGPVFRMARTPARRDRPAPDLAPAGDPAGWTDGSRPVPGTAAGGGRSTAPPLAGLSILDFTNAWAGPMATRILASLGAEIVKIEAPSRPDGWRGEWREAPTQLGYYPDEKPGDRPYDRDCWFNSQNHDKSSVVLDLKQPAALDLVQRLLPRMDAVIANFSPGALDRMGVGYADAARHNPRLVLVEMPAAGNTGPRSTQRGLGPTMEAMAGIAGLIGYPDEGPVGSGTAYLDPIGALHGGAALLTALYHREVHGPGQYVEVAQQEAAMHWVGEILLESIESGRTPELRGNNAPDACPHAAFPAAGDDEWVAIAAFDSAQWTALTRVLDVDELAADPRFGAVEGRLAHRAELEAAIAEVTRDEDKHRLAARLQAAGVPAAPVTTGRDLHTDPHLRERDWFARLEHPHAGTHDYPCLPIRYAGHRPRPGRASPMFGQHTDEVLTRHLGLSGAELAELRSAGVTATEPRAR